LAISPIRAQVDRERALDLLDGRRGERTGVGDPGVRHADVDPAEALHRLAHGAFQGAQVGDVGLDRERAIAERGGVLLEQVGLEPDEGDVRAFGIEPLGGRGTDAARCTRDEDGTAVDVVDSLVAAHVGDLRVVRCARVVASRSRAYPW
jgi:hypothetical protein